MIVKKMWLQVTDRGVSEWRREGWYLFGLVPLYIRDMTIRERRS